MKNHFLYLLLFLAFAHGQQPFSFQDSLLVFGHHKSQMQWLKNQTPSAETQYKLGLIYFDQAAYYKAVLYFQKAVDQQDKLLYWLKYISALKKLNRYGEVEKALLLLKEKFPENEELEYKLAKAYQAQYKFYKALEAYEYLLQKDSLNINYQFDMGTVFMAQENYSKAIDQFLNVYAQNSTHFKNLYRLAACYQKLKMPDSTYLFIYRGLKIRPDHKNLNRLYINQLRRDNRINAAINVLQKQDSLYPQEFFNKKSLGLCFYNQNQWNIAAEYFKAALKLNPEDYKARTYLGHIALHQKQYQNAFFSTPLQ